ncbi:hypothetical protein [Pseudoprimorskyibacter insulae]|uniref:Uncharacterized protein n=1 Tax=Pseudoprimorskyibacter insulae TaxID=1695997 RepID=A0A2R8APP1_9RHOB|nr:hypothetical protein [Pseudoprimorskyibacter insulae]SPF77824.1 hypothetical protein PRI8871_00410 [Pseudoprimorskyibacter insulae]
MTFAKPGAIIATCALVGTPVEATADTTNCADRAQVVERLAQTYGETRRSIGLGHDNSMMEVFASDITGSWTITVTQPDGMTCLVASGQSYEAMAKTAATMDMDA